MSANLRHYLAGVTLSFWVCATVLILASLGLKRWSFTRNSPYCNARALGVRLTAAVTQQLGWGVGANVVPDLGGPRCTTGHNRGPCSLLSPCFEPGFIRIARRGLVRGRLSVSG